jgi:uncharacterized protein YodC (DUF2158 family)
MAEEFMPGEVVRLKSGGPTMTVDHVGPRIQGGKTIEVMCSWFQVTKGKQERKQDWFVPTSLEKVDMQQESAFYPSRSIMEG